jgi:hypothetical protein
VQLIRDFFIEIDGQWPRASNKVRLSIIGSGALMLQTSYSRGTKDSDVFETPELTGDIQRTLVAIAGAGTNLHRRRRMYVDIVASGVPFLPHVPIWRPALGLTEALQRLEVFALDITDVVVSKLKRFSASVRRTSTPRSNAGSYATNGWSRGFGPPSMNSAAMPAPRSCRSTSPTCIRSSAT